MLSLERRKVLETIKTITEDPFRVKGGARWKSVLLVAGGLLIAGCQPPVTIYPELATSVPVAANTPKPPTTIATVIPGEGTEEDSDACPDYSRGVAFSSDQIAKVSRYRIDTEELLKGVVTDKYLNRGIILDRYPELQGDCDSYVSARTYEWLDARNERDVTKYVSIGGVSYERQFFLPFRVRDEDKYHNIAQEVVARLTYEPEPSTGEEWLTKRWLGFNLDVHRLDVKDVPDRVKRIPLDKLEEVVYSVFRDPKQLEPGITIDTTFHAIRARMVTRIPSAVDGRDEISFYHLEGVTTEGREYRVFLDVTGQGSYEIVEPFWTPVYLK